MPFLRGRVALTLLPTRKRLAERRVCLGMRGRIVPSMRLWCQECGRPSSPEAKGWRLYRLDVPDEDPEPELAACCSYCAVREFDPTVERYDDA